MFELLLFCLLSFRTFTQAAVVCYNLDRIPYTNPSGGWNPNDYTPNVCNSSAEVSSCCSTNDVCLSNGLCLHTGAENYLAVQGCTDPKWGAPCPYICHSLPYNYLGVCYPGIKEDDLLRFYCLAGGNGTSDCSKIDAKYQIGLPVGELQVRSFEVPANLINNSTITATLTGQTTRTIMASAQASSSGHEARDVGLGLGVGLILPLLLALIAAIWVLLRRTRELRQLQAERNGTWQHLQEAVPLPLWPKRRQAESTPHEADASREVLELG